MTEFESDLRRQVDKAFTLLPWFALRKKSRKRRALFEAMAYNLSTMLDLHYRNDGQTVARTNVGRFGGSGA